MDRTCFARHPLASPCFFHADIEWKLQYIQYRYRTVSIIFFVYRHRIDLDYCSIFPTLMFTALGDTSGRRYIVVPHSWCGQVAQNANIGSISACAVLIGVLLLRPKGQNRVRNKKPGNSFVATCGRGQTHPVSSG